MQNPRKICYCGNAIFVPIYPTFGQACSLAYSNKISCRCKGLNSYTDGFLLPNCTNTRLSDFYCIKRHCKGCWSLHRWSVSNFFLPLLDFQTLLSDCYWNRIIFWRFWKNPMSVGPKFLGVSECTGIFPMGLWAYTRFHDDSVRMRLDFEIIFRFFLKHIICIGFERKKRMYMYQDSRRIFRTYMNFY